MKLILGPRLFKIKVHYAVKQDISIFLYDFQNRAKGINTYMAKRKNNQMEDR
jgi:hypothetical protein